MTRTRTRRADARASRRSVTRGSGRGRARSARGGARLLGTYGTGAQTADINPEQVPIYPVLVIDVSENGEATLDGQPVPVPTGSTPEQAAMQAAAARAAAMPAVPALRVIARSATGARYTMVVAGDGRVWEEAQAASAPRRPVWLWPVVAAATTVVLGAAAASTVLTGLADPLIDQLRPLRSSAPFAQPDPVTTTEATGPVGAGANLPLAAPPGFATTAAWSVPLDERTDPVVTASGTVLAVTAGGDLVLLDPGTGRPTWQGQLPSGASGAELHLSAIDGTAVAATVLGRQLVYWPLPPDPAAPAANDAEVPEQAASMVDLPQRAEVSWAGTSPLLTLPDQTAGVIVRDEVRQLDVPVGASPLSAQAQVVTAADAAGRLWQLTPGQEAGEARQLVAPPRADPEPRRVIAAGPEHVAAVWSVREEQVVVLYEAATGRPAAVGSTDGDDLTQADVLAQSGGPLVALGSVLLDPVTPAVLTLGQGVAPQAITAGHVYATQDGTWVDVTIQGTTATAQPIPLAPDAEGGVGEGHGSDAGGGAPALPAGIITTTGVLAVVSADKVDQRLLYALPTA